MDQPAEIWTDGPQQPRLTADEVHIWFAQVQAMQANLLSFSEMLADDERTRAQRFVFERDRIRFTVARGCLRTILGRYLQIAPASIAFQYNHFGKPDIATPQGTELSFNLSHSDDLVVCAVTLNREIGVDVERIRTMQAEEIAERYFAPDEQRVLAALPPEQRLQAFFNGWTRKEAWLKAIGRGIGMGLDQVEVVLSPGERAEFRKVGSDPLEAKEWVLASFTPAPEYPAALAFKGEPCALRFWRFR